MKSKSRTSFFVKTFIIIGLTFSCLIGIAWYFLVADHTFEIIDELKPTIQAKTVRIENNDLVIQKLGDWDFYQGDFSDKNIIGQSLPATWRPYSANSPWNTPIKKDAQLYHNSNKLIATAVEEASHLRLVKYYNSPIWVVNSKKMPQLRVSSKRIFDTWDKDRDNWTDIEIPIDPRMWSEGTEDGHMIIVDPFTMTAWEMSRFKWKKTVNGFIPTSTTFNVWDLKGKGYAEPLEGERWRMRGGRGSGFPILAGLIRPEELKNGEIRHALFFNYSKVRKSPNGDKEMFISPPASRGDGDTIGEQYLIEGMRLQLNPKLTDENFEQWGLNREGKIIARALQKYGMYLGDSGGAMSIGIQQLAKTKGENMKKWNTLFPDLYRTVANIPTRELRVIYTNFPREE